MSASVFTVPGGTKLNVGNYSDHVTVLGNGTIIAGQAPYTMSAVIEGNGVFQGGNGDDNVGIWGKLGSISVGSGNDTLFLWANGTINQTGTTGMDTINLYTGDDTIFEQGHATVNGSSYGSFGGATIAGGELKVVQADGFVKDTAVSGTMTLLGSAAPTQFIGGTGSTDMIGGSGSDTFVGGSGYDTMTGGSGSNVFEFLKSEAGGQHVITNFVSGDQLYVEGESLSFLQSHHDISVSGGNTYISIDGGSTTIELKGVTSLSSSDIITHKP